MSLKPTITQELLRELLHYDPVTGAFVWVKARRNARPGDDAGHCEPRGYRYISLLNHPFAAHRLAFLYMTGYWPSGIVDHCNGVKSDNRWRNLRDTTGTVNAQNVRAATKRNQLGLLGVIPPQGSRRRFKASIQKEGRQHHLGYHDTPELAHAAYVAAKRQLHEGGTL